MAEQIKRRVDEVLYELFKGNDAALEKYAKVRHTKYEIHLWQDKGFPLNEISSGAKRHFKERFLLEKSITEASEPELKKAIEKLGYAADACRGRCLRLVGELNDVLEQMGISRLNTPERFLDWLTFNYYVEQDCYGDPVQERGVEIRVFTDSVNRKDFWTEIITLLNRGRIMSMVDIYKIVREKRENSVEIS